MNVERTSGAQSPRWLLFLGLGAGAVLGCSAYATRTEIPPDCSIEGAYDFENMPYELSGTSSNFWASGDHDAGAYTMVEPLTEGPLCGTTSAVVIVSDHNNDWGSLSGVNNLSSETASVDKSMWDGLSFWARAPGNTTKSFTLILDDVNTANPNTMGLTAAETDGGLVSNCKPTAMDGGGGGPIYDSTGMLISGATMDAPPPNACGNGFITVVVVTADWRFYTLPYGKFQQLNKPNRVPNSVFTESGNEIGTTLLTSKLMNITIRMPKEAKMALWLDKLRFYKKRQVAGDDAGANAQ